MTIPRSSELLAIPDRMLCICGHTASEHGNRWGGLTCDVDDHLCDCGVFTDTYEEAPEPESKPEPEPKPDPDSCASCEHELLQHTWNGCGVGTEFTCRCSGFTVRKRAGQ